MENKLYIDLMKNVLTDYHRMDLGEYKPVFFWRSIIMRLLNKIPLATFRKLPNYFVFCKVIEFNKARRMEGRDWPSYADTMIGIKRMENIEYCMRDVLKNNVPGDMIETGVWRGGATIFMKAILKSFNDTERKVWVADSFEGLPRPNEEKYAADKGDKHYTKSNDLAISKEQVEANFAKYDLLDDNVKFLKGWFKDTLPTMPADKFAVIRLDGDMYESTMDALKALYPKLSIGGYVIIDDWGAVKGCKLAVEDYRKEHNITEDIVPIDWAGVYWQKKK